MPEFTLTPIEKILKENGAPRVSKEAVELFANELETLALEIARDATELSKHGQRKTISKEDVKMAIKRAHIA